MLPGKDLILPRTVSYRLRTPELDKIRSTRKEKGTQFIGEFLEWLSRKNYTICEIQESRGEMGEYSPLYVSIETLLAQYCEIDLDKAEKERRAILEHIRSKNP